MKKFSAVLLGIVFLFVSAQGASATTTPQLQRPVCTINASSYSVRLGGTVNLTWSSQDATSGTITSLGNVALYGSQGVIPTGAGTTYVGTFTGPGGTGTCSVRVSTSDTGGGGDGGDGGVDGGGTVDTSGNGTIDTSGTINTPGGVNSPGTLGAPPTQNAAPILQGGSGGGSSGSGASNPLVPCNGIDCQACKLATLGQNIINFLVGLSIPLAAVMFAYAGFIYFSSSVIDKIEKAKKIFTSVLIGFAIVIGGYLIVETILHTILNESYWKSWNQIQCVSQGARKTDATIAELLKGLSVTNSGGTGTGGDSCSSGSTSAGAGVCKNTDTGAYSLASGYKCDSGFDFSAMRGVCVDANGGERTPTKEGGGGGGGESDATNREILRNAGINVNAAYPQTSLAGMRSETMAEIMSVCGHAEPAGTCYVTGGTETTGGHSCGGEYSHCNGYKFDVRPTTGVDSYISELCGGRNQCTINNKTYTREGDHWDILVR